MSKGAYVLVIRLDKDSDIKVGKRPATRFPRGFYCYVGSAMNNLEARIGRHMSRDKRRRWHIDWLLEEAVIVDVRRIESPERLECRLSRDLAGLSGRVVMKGFGSSDCSCRTHLHYFKEDPSGELDRLMSVWSPERGYEDV